MTSGSVLRALARQISTSAEDATKAQVAAGRDHGDPASVLRRPPAPLPGYKVTEVTISPRSPAVGVRLGDVAWPPGSVLISVLRGHSCHDPQPRLRAPPR